MGKRDAQTANEEQVRVSGVLNGKTSTTESVDGLSGTDAFEFNTGRSAYPFSRTAEERVTGKNDSDTLFPPESME